MNIFDIINDIMYKKSGSLLNKSEYESEFQPYMVQRWLSMHSVNNARILNKTVNQLNGAIKENSQWYKLFLTSLPKCKFKRFRYIKKSQDKPSVKHTDMSDAIKFVAEQNKMSEREVKMYVEEYGVDISSIQKTLKSK